MRDTQSGRLKKTCASVFTFFFISRLGFVLRPLPGPEQAVGDVATHVLRHQRPLPTQRHPLKWKQLYGFLLNSVADLNPTDLHHFPGSGSVSYRFCLYPDPYQSSVWIRIHNNFVKILDPDPYQMTRIHYSAA